LKVASWKPDKETQRNIKVHFKKEVVRMEGGCKHFRLVFSGEI
jgi:hypothetical protein